MDHIVPAGTLLRAIGAKTHPNLGVGFYPGYTFESQRPPRLNPIPALDLTPFALVLSGMFYGWGLFRLGLLELMPVASEVVLENLRDGVLVLDNHDQVVYLNPAFQEYSGISSQEAVGWTAREVLSRWPELVDQFKTTMDAHTHISVRISPEDLRRFEMRISPIFDNRVVPK